MKISLCILIIISLLFSGCAMVSYQSKSEGTGITKKQLNTIKPGVTTKKEILMSLGPPDEIIPDTAGEAFVYKHTTTSEAKFEFLLGLSRESSKTKTLTIFFNKDGVVESYSYKPKPGL